MSFRTAALFFCCLGLVAWVGCGPTNTAGDGDGDDDHGEHAGHDHGHDDHHEGPHGGHILEFDKEGYHAEWTHDDEAKVVGVFILDESGKKDVMIDAESVAIEVTIEDSEPQTFELLAVNSEEGVGASQFELEDQELLVHLKLTGKEEANVKATLKAVIDGETYAAGIVEEEHHHHHH